MFGDLVKADNFNPSSTSAAFHSGDSDQLGQFTQFGENVWSNDDPCTYAGGLKSNVALATLLSSRGFAGGDVYRTTTFSAGYGDSGTDTADVDSLDDPVWGPSAPRGARITAAAHGARAQRRRVQQEAGCRLPSAGGFSFIACRLQVRTKEAPAARPVTSNGRSDFGPRSATGTAEVSSASVSRRHAGISGFLANRDEMYLQSDEDGPQWERLLHAWRRKYGGDAVPVARVEEDIVGDEQLREALPDAFTRFIERVMGQFNAVTFRIGEAGKFKIRLGKALKHRLGRRFGLDKPPPHSRRRFPHHHHQGDHGTSGPDAPQDAG